MKILKNFGQKRVASMFSKSKPLRFFFVWGILESKAYAKKHKNIETLKNFLVREWEKLPQNLLYAICDDIPR